MMPIGKPDLWRRVAERLESWAAKDILFRYGQDNSLRWIAQRLLENGVIIADEVGLGKTRLALMTLFSTLEEGGSAAVVVPSGLMYQWKQEAGDTVKSLMEAGCVTKDFHQPAMLRTYHGLYSDFGGNLEPYPLVSGQERRWCLISQAFDLYPIRKEYAWARGIELPYLIQGRLKKIHGRNLLSQFLKKRGLTRIHEQENPDPYLLAEAMAAKYLTTSHFKSTVKHLLNLPDMPIPRTDGTRLKYSEFFNKANAGGRLLLRLAGMLVGDIDLLIIDEAHKARGDDTRLGHILTDILSLANNSRRISMTATPVEISSHQWFSLLRRTGIDETHADWKRIETVIPEFAAALQATRATPGNSTTIERLLQGAGEFQSALEPFVTRRMRIRQRDMIKLLPPGVSGGAQPHRKFMNDTPGVRIAIEDLDRDWRRMVMALEGQGLAAKGCAGLDMKNRQIDIRYSSGLDCDFDTGDKEADSPSLPAKERRYRAWSRYLAGAMKRKAGGDWLWDHPRILRAAILIESLCDFDRIHPREKVLVFGRYSRPIKMLDDTLNLRYALRLLDHGAVGIMPRLRADGTSADSTVTTKAAEEAAGRMEHFHFLYRKGLEAGEFSLALKDTDWSPDRLLEAVEVTTKRYQSLRDRLLRQFNKDRIDWIEKQPGDAVIENLRRHDTAKYNELFTMLRDDVLDRLRGESEETIDKSREAIDRYAHQAWVRHLHCIVHDRDRDEEEEVGKSTPYTGDDAKLLELDAEGDRLTPQRLVAYIDSHRRSDFSRLLNGGLPHSTKQAVQESFNEAGSPPFVLIAQSEVGREGLNLHRQCRRIVLFHPEWNPGVLEQQIGRVDRIQSKWVEMAEAYRDNGGGAEGYPYIEIYPLIFQGTYDEYQAEILFSRRDALNAQLFGKLLDATTMEKIPGELWESIANAAPQWEPARTEDDFMGRQNIEEGRIAKNATPR